MITEELYQNIENNIYDNAELYKKASNNLVDVSILFEIKTTQCKEINAYAETIERHKIYKITLLKNLVLALFGYASEISENITSFSMSFTTTDKEKIRDYLFYFWIDVVCAHEFSHIIYGHTDFLMTALCEFPSEQQHVDMIYLEAEADAKAAEIVLARLSTVIDKLEYLYKDSSTTQEKLSDFISMMILFFRFLGEFDIANYTTHPTPFQRSFIFLSFFNAACNKIVGLEATQREIQKIMDKNAMTYFMIVGDHDKLIQLLNDANNFQSSVDANLERIGIQEYRIKRIK